MAVALWVITDGQRDLEPLIKSCSPYNVRLLCWKEPKAGIVKDTRSIYHLCDFSYNSTDTYFTANFNRILWWELHKGIADAVMIMNDDIRWTPGALKKLIEFAENFQKPWASINPTQVNEEGLVIMGGVGACFPTGMHVRYTKHDYGEYKTWPWVPFCSPMLNMDAVRTVGLPDANFRMWFSDSDWCMRASCANLPCIIHNDCHIIHQEHGTIDAMEQQELFSTDQSLFYYKYGGKLLNDYS